MNAIEFKGVSKKFRKGEKFDSLRDLIPNLVKGLFSRNGKKLELKDKEFWAVNDVSFELKKGEILGIIGPNGAGKSTILKLLSGLLKPTKGEIKINGRLSALIEVGAGFHQDLTGRENIYLNGAIMGMNKKEIDRKFDEIVAFSELEEFIDTPVKRYSSGMYVRLGFSVSAHIDPEILLIDEILSVGDITFQRKCFEKMKDFLQKGVTIIFISHNLPSVVNLCPKAILLNKGQIQKIGETKKVVHAYYNAWGKSLSTDKGNIKIENYVLLNSDGKTQSSFNAGENALLRISFRSNISLEKVSVGLVVKREDGFVVFEAHSSTYEGKIYHFIIGQTEKIELTLNLALPSGLYYLGLYLQHNQEVYYHNDELCQFLVVAPKLCSSSFTFLNTKWE